MSLLSDLMNILRAEMDVNSTIPADDEDFNPMDYFGGNFDDTFNGGESHGRASLAKELLLFIRENT